ncbi:hypothetical protein WMF45_49395 [Sorangium sp. So ce448]
MEGERDERERQMILVTGATGNVGGAVLEQLVRISSGAWTGRSTNGLNAT